jgi:hypothetical protein
MFLRDSEKRADSSGNSDGATSMCAAATATNTINANAFGALLAMSAFRH